jgi:glycerol-3-phosphate cytidylyltransferase-like family protein
MTMASIMSNFAIYASLAIYYITVFSDIAQHMNLPMFNTVTNIYCDGIFDLLHRGHMEQFRQVDLFKPMIRWDPIHVLLAPHSLLCLTFLTLIFLVPHPSDRQAHSVFPGGTRLFVGVCNDEDTCGYKRPPIMSESERYAAVASCKYVHKVIEASPIVHSTSKPGEEKTRSELMVEKDNIHYFAIGREYETVKEGKKDYYALAKERGMALYTERTGGISTSELIQRIAKRAPEFLED